VDEREWLTSADPRAMLAYLEGRATDRKSRLLLVALWRRRFGTLRTYQAYQKKLAQAEAMADGAWRPGRGHTGWVGHQRNPHYHAAWSVEVLAGLRGKGNVPLATQADLIRDVFGNPFRPPASVNPAWLAWNTGTVRRLAEAAYEERVLPAGTLDNARLAVLADALQEAGCDDSGLLEHLRGPGPHVPGCFAIDAILGRE
jgi:hypothetical protein